MKNNLGLFLSKRALLSPDREAYVESDGSLRLTFKELNLRCNQLANAFVEAACEKGERVGLLLMNSSEFMESYYALAKIGAVVVPLNWRLVADELEFILKDSGTSRLIFDNEFVDTVAELHSRGDKTDINQWLQVTNGDVAYFAQSYRGFRDAASTDEPEVSAADHDMLYIMYTSGTTGITQRCCAYSPHFNLGFVEYFRHCHLSRSRALFGLFAYVPCGGVNAIGRECLYRGVTSVVMRSFDPVSAWETIEREKITSGLAVPAMLSLCSRCQILSALITLACAGL